MKLNVPALLLLPLVAVTVPVHAESGARVVKYSETEIIPIRAKVRFSTLIVLPADEEILDFTTGDKDFWIINGVHNLCYLHPAQTGIRSNLNLVTSSGHVYSFLLSEISKENDSDPDLKVFVTRDSEQAGSTQPTLPKLVRASEVEAYRSEIAELRTELNEQKKEAHDQAEKEITQYRTAYPSKLEFDYTVNKKAARAPFFVTAIYHDDRFTYVKSAAREKPAIYEIKDGKPNLINFDLENGVYIVPKIVDDGYLAVGKKRVTFHRQLPRTSDVQE
ncbi:MAG TPA: TrbG/VirB9 family P-type conjugative transfer protein [Terriglobales bacterium]|nr:TrbG/VirB9 family P-type conjugative transfer protein [Terriglobales bacterium]